MKKQLPFVFLLSFVLAACATTAKYEKALDSWVNVPETELVKQWGPPDSVYQAESGTKMLTYYTSKALYSSPAYPNYQIISSGDTVFINTYGEIPRETREVHCKTSFTVTKGKVLSWRWEGNNCAQ